MILRRKIPGRAVLAEALFFSFLLSFSSKTPEISPSRDVNARFFFPVFPVPVSMTCVPLLSPPRSALLLPSHFSYIYILRLASFFFLSRNPCHHFSWDIA